MKILGRTAIPVGSRVTCNPPPTDTDADYLIYVPASVAQAYLAELTAQDWVSDLDTALIARYGQMRNSDNLPVHFTAMRKGEENLIITWSKPFHQSFLAATAVAKRLNLMERDDRVALFDTLRRNWPGLEDYE